MGDERSVAHVGFLDVVAWFDAYELGHQAIHHIGVVLRLIGVGVGCESQFCELGVCHVVESKEVCASFLDSAAVGFQGVGVHARQ